MNILAIEAEALKEICNMTVRLTQIRQGECNHLVVENYAPALFGKLMDEYLERVIIDISRDGGGSG